MHSRVKIFVYWYECTVFESLVTQSIFSMLYCATLGHGAVVFCINTMHCIKKRTFYIIKSFNLMNASDLKDINRGRVVNPVNSISPNLYTWLSCLVSMWCHNVINIYCTFCISAALCFSQLHYMYPGLYETPFFVYRGITMIPTRLLDILPAWSAGVPLTCTYFYSFFFFSV